MELNDSLIRIYIGPHHTHYDWSAINLGSTFSPVQTTTTGQVSGATSLVLASGTGIGATAGVWVGPNGSLQGWEYEQITAGAGGTKTVVRESVTDRDHNGVHSSGAIVYPWFPVTTNDGTMSLSDETNEEASVTSWRASISGVLAPYSILRNGHIVVVTESVNGGAYTVALVGFLDSPSVDDDRMSTATWTVDVLSVAQVVSEQEVSGKRVGDEDLADAGTASSVTTLVLPYDERTSGDFTAAAPDVSASSAIDNDLSTVWIAEHYTGTDIWYTGENNDDENGYPIRFSHIYINPPTSAGAGARFIEIAVVEDINFIGYAINSAWGSSGTFIWIFKGPGEVTAGSRIFLVEDQEVFARLNPLAESVAIYENREFFESLLVSGGEFWLRVGEINSWQARVRWGTGRTIDHEDAPDRSWSGPTVTPPATGQTMRYLHNHTTGTPSTYWNTSMVRHAGYNIDDDDPNWIMVTLPGMGLTLAAGITASVPGFGESLYIYGADEKYSTDGLPASGIIMVGDEQISYGSKTSQYLTVTARGVAGTTAAIHNAKDEVYIMVGAVPTDAFLIKQIGFQHNGGTIHPKNFKLRTSMLVDAPRNPDQDDYTLDYNTGYAVTNNSASSWSVPLYGIRVKHFVLEVESMTVDPARPRVSELNAIIDPACHNPDQWLVEGTTAGALIARILQDSGVWAGAISHSGTPALLKTVTAEDNAWAVVSDIAEYAACRVTVRRDSKITIAPETFWTGTPTVTTQWTRTNTVSINKSWRKSSPVAQVILPWRTPSGEADGKIFFPQIPERGEKIERDETLYNGFTAANNAARRLYYMRQYPYEVMISAAGNYATLSAGDAHRVTWDFDPSLPPVDRNYLVMSADHRLERGHWTSSFRLLQYGHESNF